jgi:carbon storage regulator
MHFIARRTNEGLVIGDDIEVTVLEIQSDHVRLGISSPNEIPAYWEQTVYCEQSAESPSELQVNS